MASSVVRAAIYTRISKDDGRGLGVARQLADCTALCAHKTWEVARVFTDNDTSAYSGTARPQYALLLAAITAREIDAVIAYDLDRLVRRPAELEAFFTTCDTAGLTKMATASGDMRLDHDDDVFRARILGAVAAKESDAKSRRLRRKMQQRRDDGFPPAGRAYGWATSITHHPDEAPIVAELVERFLRGESITRLVADLNARAIPPVYASTWSRTSVRKLLEAPRHAGLVSYQGKVIGPGTFPPIITPEQHYRVAATITGRRRGGRVHPLTGVLTCGKCEVALVGGYGAYRCKVAGCGAVYVGCEIAERAAIAMLIEAVDLDVFSRARVADLAPLYARVDLLESRLVELTTDYHAHALITRDEWISAREVIVAEMESTRKEIGRAEIVQPEVKKVDLAKWDEMSVEQQARHYRAFFTSIVVNPRGVGERMTPLWRC